MELECNANSVAIKITLFCSTNLWLWQDSRMELSLWLVDLKSAAIATPTPPMSIGERVSSSPSPWQTPSSGPSTTEPAAEAAGTTRAPQPPAELRDKRPTPPPDPPWRMWRNAPSTFAEAQDSSGSNNSWNTILDIWKLLGKSFATFLYFPFFQARGIF